MSLPEFSRRRLIGMACATAIAAPAVLTASQSRASSPATPFWQPPLDEGRMVDGKRVFDLKVAAGQTEFFPGHMTDTVGINAAFLGPQLRARSGDRLKMNVANGWNQPLTLHWHGLHLPAATDGGPHQVIAPGAVWTPEFTLMQKAGMFWFHGHQHHNTGPHVWAGMAGLLRVEDDEEAALALPRAYGEDDFSLVLQDRTFDSDYQLPYALNMHSRMAGLQGDRAMVNGRLNPVLEPRAPRIRLRLLNGSNGSIYRLHFSDDRRFWQIASDGGLLSAPEVQSQVMLAPGERAELLVDIHDGAAAFLRAEVFGAEAAFAGSNGTLDFLELRPDRARPPAPPPPARLADLAPVPAQTGETRKLTLAMTGPGMMGDFTINGVKFDHDRIDFAVPVGAVETWLITNNSEMLHPMHIHDVQFRIVSRNGNPPIPHEAGLKDTVLVAPRETVELRLSFADYTDPVLPYMFHCHILEHEDAGMMGQFTVV